ncbi:alpha/beta fold hydrolase [Labedella endophytica]|uniref:Alpha/beta fold hydrolase n=1 Tax=Labedella endophytica TaxID=1523160 RepID=A0A433JPM1_9MICO|nr:alpha/beta fold hydrolase [Labedella endophytica]RUQ98214.1 alpha/beta fold hydrolase [Labedella endophytica]
MSASTRVHHVASESPGLLVVHEYGEPARGRAPIVFLPALGVPLAYYLPLFTEWAARRRHVFGVELRGMPATPVDDLRRQPFGYGELVRHDLPAVFSLPALEEGAVAVGHSLGGQLAVLATASGAISPRAVVTIATGSSALHRSAPLVARWRRAAEIATVRMSSAALGYWPGHRLGFGGRQPRLLMRDWAFEARTGRYRLVGDPTDYESLLSTITPPILLVTIDGDPLITPESVDTLARRLPGTAERMTVAAGARDHFLWARRAPHLVIDPVDTWLAARDGVRCG